MRYGIWRSAGSIPDSAMIATLSLVALLYLTLCMNRSIGVVDEGLILVGATRVADGAIPHRDFYFLYGPGQLYVLATLFKIFGTSVLVERAWDTLVRCSIVVLITIIISKVTQRWLALLTAGTSLVCVASFGFYGYPVFPALAAALAGGTLLAPTLGASGFSSRLVAAGMCVGVAALFRYDVGTGTFVSQCAIVGWSAWYPAAGKERRLRVVLLPLVWFAVGFAVAVVPVALTFLLCGVIPDLIFQVVTYPAHFYIKMRSLPFPHHLWELRADPREFIGVYLPLVLCSASVPIMIAIARCGREDEGDAESAGPRLRAGTALLWTLIMLVVLTLVYYVKGMVRTSTIHMAMSLITSLALAGLLARALPRARLVGRSMILASLVAAAIFTFFSLRAELDQASQNIAWATDPASWELSPTGMPPISGSCRVPAGFENMACFPMSAETIETIRYVQQRTGPNDPVFVGLSRHDRIFVSDVLLYFAVNRTPATKWYELDPGLQTSAPIQQEMVGELQRTKPKLIVLEANWTDVREPNDSALSSGVTVLDDYLRRAFEPVATFGANTILRARSREQP